MFSLAGIPPLAGFIGKLYVFKAAIDAGLIWFAVVGVVLSVVGAYYYLRIVKLMYFDEPAERVRRRRRRFRSARSAGVCAALLLLFMVPFCRHRCCMQPRRPPRRPWRGDRRAARSRLPPRSSSPPSAAPTTSPRDFAEHGEPEGLFVRAAGRPPAAAATAGAGSRRPATSTPR